MMEKPDVDNSDTTANGDSPPESTMTPNLQNIDLEKSYQPPQSNQTQQEVGEERNAILVRFDEGDPENPKNWNIYYKAWLTFQMSMLAFVGSLGSSITSPANTAISEYLGVGLEVTVLTLSLFVLGM